MHTCAFNLLKLTVLLSQDTMVHPLDPITETEARQAVTAVKNAYPGTDIHFKSIQIDEPPKSKLLPFLNAEGSHAPLPPPPRIAYAIYYRLADKLAEQAWIDLESGSVTRTMLLPSGSHPGIDEDEALLIEPLMLADPEVQAALDRLGLTQEERKCVAGDGWMYGCDSYDMQPRYINFLMYMRDPKTNHPDSLVYARPLPFVPVYDVLDKSFVRIDWCATGGDEDDRYDTINYDTRPGNPICEDFIDGEIMPELRPETKLRTDLKPYNVIQPDGPSFELEGNLIKWQKWQFRVGITPREGLVLHDVKFDGRRTFYRLSVSEMTVPYGDPRPPLCRKQAFDLGEVGAAYCANSLELGCDCLGTIKYFDANLVRSDGSVNVKKNIVCMHEQDDGILFKHTNYRTNNARVARRRVLVLQTILTVLNYEYIFAWHLDQAANIELEIRATGIVSTNYIDPGKTSKWGTIVAPSVLAGYHQHIFSVRMDPALDGQNNSVAVHEAKLDVLDKKNEFGTGFHKTTEYVETSSAFDCDQPKGRYVGIYNENKINPVSKKPIGYKLNAYPSALLLAPQGTIARNRAQFATHHFWVTKYRDGEVFGGGIWPNQACRETGGVQDMVDRREPVRNEDVVLWHSFGLTHMTRVEDWPVMPLEKVKIGLHPTGFFTENPAMDQPQSVQSFNRSVEIVKTKCCNKM